MIAVLLSDAREWSMKLNKDRTALEPYSLNQMYDSNVPYVSLSALEFSTRTPCTVGWVPVMLTSNSAPQK